MDKITITITMTTRQGRKYLQQWQCIVYGFYSVGAEIPAATCELWHKKATENITNGAGGQQ